MRQRETRVGIALRLAFSSLLSRFSGTFFSQSAGGLQRFECLRLIFSDPQFYKYSFEIFKVGNVCFEGNRTLNSYLVFVSRPEQPIMTIRYLEMSTPFRKLSFTSQRITSLYERLPVSAVNTPHFLTIKGVEVNAGQTASFHCTVNGRKRDNFRLWLQVSHLDLFSQQL